MNARRYDAVLFDLLTALALPQASDVGQLGPSHHQAAPELGDQAPRRRPAAAPQHVVVK